MNKVFFLSCMLIAMQLFASSNEGIFLQLLEIEALIKKEEAVTKGLFDEIIEVYNIIIKKFEACLQEEEQFENDIDYLHDNFKDMIASGEIYTYKIHGQDDGDYRLEYEILKNLIIRYEIHKERLIGLFKQYLIKIKN